MPTPEPVPPCIFAQASPISLGGVSLFDAGRHIRTMSAASFYSAPAVVEAAAARLQQAGFEVLQKTALTINIAGSLETYERAFGRKLMTKEVTMFEGVTTTCLDSPGVPISGLLPTAGTPFADVLEGVALEVPRGPVELTLRVQALASAAAASERAPIMAEVRKSFFMVVVSLTCEGLP